MKKAKNNIPHKEPIPAQARQLVRTLAAELGEDEVWVRCRWSYKSGWGIEVVVPFNGYYDQIKALIRLVDRFKWVVSWHKDGLELHIWHDTWYDSFKKHEARKEKALS